MKILKTVAALALAVVLGACEAVETVSRDVTPENSGAAHIDSPYSVAGINVDVPTTLRVSEENLIFPLADIVWRGDAYGDRHQQVAAIFNKGLMLGAAQLNGPQAVTLDVEVMRFHSLTELARYATGGTHAITFRLTVRDATSGDVIDGPRRVRANLAAWSAERYMAGEREGITAKTRITSHLGGVIQRELGLAP